MNSDDKKTVLVNLLWAFVIVALFTSRPLALSAYAMCGVIWITIG
jgi:hypothetical protein